MSVAAVLVAGALILAACGTLVAVASSRSAGAQRVPGGFVAQSITQMGSSASVIVAGTVPCGHRVCPALLRGSLGAAGLVQRWMRLQPPPLPPARNPVSSNLGRFVFANRLDGYDIVAPRAVGGSTAVYATTDGGAAWSRVHVGSGTTLTMVATGSELYAVTASCGRQSCSDYRLSRSATGSTRWSSVALPGSGSLAGSGVGLAAIGSQVVVDYAPPIASGEARLLWANNGRPPWHSRLVPGMPSVAACSLTAVAGGALWAACPTGMFVSYLRSRGVNGSFRPVWDYPGTGGGGLVAVSAKVAYRFTGVATTSPVRVPADTLQRTTDAGRRFTTVGRLPFARDAGGVLVFVDGEDGFGLGAPPRRDHPGSHPVDAVFETADGGVHWSEVIG